MLAQDLARNAKPVEWVVDGLIARGATLVVAGPAKLAKKSLFALGLGLAVAQGKPFLGRTTIAMPVVYSFLEDGEERARRRFRQFGVLDTEDVIHMRGVFWKDGLQAGLDAIAKAPHLWVVDSLIKLAVYSGIGDENDSVLMTDLIERYRPAIQATGSVMVIIHHHAKYLPVMRGSSALSAVLDGWFNLVPQGGGRKLAWTLRDADAGEMGVRIELTGNGVELDRRWQIAAADLPSETATDQHANAIRAFVFQRGLDDVFDMAEFATACAVSVRNRGLQAAVAGLITAGELAPSGNGRGRIYRAGKLLRAMGAAAKGGNGNGGVIGF